MLLISIRRDSFQIHFIQLLDASISFAHLYDVSVWERAFVCVFRYFTVHNAKKRYFVFGHVLHSFHCSEARATTTTTTMAAAAVVFLFNFGPVQTCVVHIRCFSLRFNGGRCFIFCRAFEIFQLISLQTDTWCVRRTLWRCGGSHTLHCFVLFAFALLCVTVTVHTFVVIITSTKHVMLAIRSPVLSYVFDVFVRSVRRCVVFALMRDSTRRFEMKWTKIRKHFRRT